MQSSGPAPFEVTCERCRVTFPLGTRRCIHCGGPTGASPSRAPARFEARRKPEPPRRPELGRKPAPARKPEPDREPEAEANEALPELGGRRFVSPVTLMWIALIAAGYLYRACAGQAP